MTTQRNRNPAWASALVLGLLIASCGAPRPANDGDGVWMGIFDEASPNNLSGVASLEAQIGKRFASVMWFQDWSTGFATDRAHNATNAGYLPNVTWEPWFFGDQEKIRLNDIVAGSWDPYITQWGRDAAAFGKPIMVRWGHEFNGDWYPWSVAKNGQSPQLYIEAYRRVHDLVTQAGATNVVWVWCPNADSQPAQGWNNPALAYPGDEYVDWIAIDGYDFDGNDTFVSKFERLYRSLTAAFNKPLYVGEMSSGRKGADRAAWIEGMHQALTGAFPAIKGFVWFNIKKERDWRLEESPESLAAAVKAFSQPFYHARPESVATLAKVYSENRATYVERVAATRVPRPRLEVPRVRGADLSGAPTIPISDKSGLEGTLRLGWDQDFLHLLVEVSDATPLRNPQKKGDIWNGDNLEVCLSTDTQADPERGFYTESDWQFGFSTGDPAQGVAPSTWEWSQIKGPVTGAKAVAHPTAEGYRLEVSLPWAALKGFRPEAGWEVGFDLALDNGGAAGTRVGQWIWSGNSSFYNNPAQWGVLAFTD